MLNAIKQNAFFTHFVLFIYAKNKLKVLSVLASWNTLWKETLFFLSVLIKQTASTATQEVLGET